MRIHKNVVIVNKIYQPCFNKYPDFSPAEWPSLQVTMSNRYMLYMHSMHKTTHTPKVVHDFLIYTTHIVELMQKKYIFYVSAICKIYAYGSSYTSSLAIK